MNFIIIIVLMTNEIFAIDLPTVRDKSQCQMIALDIIKDREADVKSLICVPKMGAV